MVIETPGWYTNDKKLSNDIHDVTKCFRRSKKGPYRKIKLAASRGSALLTADDNLFETPIEDKFMVDLTRLCREKNFLCLSVLQATNYEYR